MVHCLPLAALLVNIVYNSPSEEMFYLYLDILSYYRETKSNLLHEIFDHIGYKNLCVIYIAVLNDCHLRLPTCKYTTLSRIGNLVLLNSNGSL